MPPPLPCAIAMQMYFLAGGNKVGLGMAEHAWNRLMRSKWGWVRPCADISARTAHHSQASLYLHQYGKELGN